MIRLEDAQRVIAAAQREASEIGQPRNIAAAAPILGAAVVMIGDRLRIAKIVNAEVITLDQAPKGYKDFDKGVARKYVLDPHGMVAAAA